MQTFCWRWRIFPPLSIRKDREMSNHSPLAAVIAAVLAAIGLLALLVVSAPTMMALFVAA